MTGKQEGPYKGEETKAEEDKVWQSVDHYNGHTFSSPAVFRELQVQTRMTRDCLFCVEPIKSSDG